MRSGAAFTAFALVVILSGGPAAAQSCLIPTCPPPSPSTCLSNCGSPDLSGFSDAAMLFVLVVGAVVAAIIVVVLVSIVLRHRRKVKAIEATTRVTVQGDPPDPGSPTPGEVFMGKYAIERRLGEGAHGVTWLARHLKLGRPVVLKALRGAGGSAEDAQRLEREARLLARLDHPNVVRVYDVEAPPRAVYLVMEYVDGGSLDAKLAQGSLSPSAALDVAAQVLAGLAHVHERGLVHGDIKPANILMTAGGAVKLADFGVARGPEAAGTLILSGGSSGTPLFMSPEQLAGAPASVQSDLYAVGLLAVAMMQGGSPYDPPPRSLASLGLVASRPPRIPSQAPAAMAAWILRACALDLAERFQSADQMRDAMPSKRL